jgi:hypothetical protein
MPESKPMITTIQATPGWYVAMFIPGCHSGTEEEQWDDHLSLRQIVAWEIERYQQPEHSRWNRRVSHDVTPLTTDGNMDHYAFDVNGDMRDTEADAIQELKSLYEGKPP